MVQTKVKRSGKSGSGGSPRKSASTGRSRNTSARSNGATSSRTRRASKSSASKASRATKHGAPSGSRRKSSGPITGLTRYLRSVRNKSMNGRGRAVASKAKGVVATGSKGLGVVGRAANRAKSVAAVGAVGLAGLAGGIALDRWNNSYSRTQAFAQKRRGRR